LFYCSRLSLPELNAIVTGQAILRKSIGTSIVAHPEDISTFISLKNVSITPEQFGQLYIAYDAETESGSSGSGIISQSGREVQIVVHFSLLCVFIQVLGLHHSQIRFSITRFGTRSTAILHKLDELLVSLPQDYDTGAEVT
jgi:hypothetical protein